MKKRGNPETNVRSALNIQLIRHFSTKEIVAKAHTYPHQLPFPSRLVAALEGNQEFTKHKAARLGQILGYKLNHNGDRHSLITQLVETAQSGSDIRVLINGLLALHKKVTIPSIQELTAA